MMMHPNLSLFTDEIPVDALNIHDARADVARLANEMRRHDVAYYTQNAPLISDAEYDKLRQRLEAIEARYPELVSAESPTQKVGAKAAEGSHTACPCSRLPTRLMNPIYRNF